MYTKLVLHFIWSGMYHSLTITLLLGSKVPYWFCCYSECFSEQLSNCFWVCVCASAPAKVQVFLWGQICKNRMSELI